MSRLFGQFQPENYNLTFDINEDTMHFRGRVIIDGKKVGRPSQRITLHQNGLKVTSARMVKHGKKGEQAELAVTRINNQDTLQEVRLHTESMVYAGRCTLTLEFEAPLTTGMTGIYPCFFKDSDTDKMLVATQFESHHAREAFPCIDEPEAKAIFNLTLVTRPKISTLGNTPIQSQEEKDGRMTTTFEATPRMSSYLLAFVIGELHSKSTKTARGTDVNVWATVAQPVDSLNFALDVAKRSIEFFEEYFDINYPLPKADHVACPDFSSGAMENWGLITYREAVLLAYPGETAQSTLERIALVIAHETSHQWFGNLVTMQWWNDLWLNESFANMMEYQAVDAMFPEWHIWNEFVAAEGLSALRRDAVAGVQAVRTDVHHPDEISTLFDPSIVYAKGGRLLYMLKNYVGEDAFRTGLKKYFETHKYGNTEGADLWAALSEASGKDIASFMNPWLTRSGFPVVSISQKDAKLTITQQHFLDNPEKADPERLWPVPLFASDKELPAMLDNRELVVPVQGAEPILLNTEARGHYIVNYVDNAHRAALGKLIETQAISSSDRLMLLNGASMLARSGLRSYRHVLELLASYRNETAEPVWDIMALVIGETRRFIDMENSLDDAIKPFVDKLVTKQVQRLGWEQAEDEPSADTKLRALVLGLSAYTENPATVKKATELFAAYQKASASVPSELRTLAFIIPIKNGDDAAFDYLIKLHDSTQNSELRGDACDALTATRQPEKAKLLLNRLTDAKLVKPQDVDRWLAYLLRNRFTRNTAWDWMVTNWHWLEKTFKNDKSYDYLPRYAAGCVNTREYQQKFHDLFDSKQDQPLLTRNIQLGFEEIETRLAWLERDLAQIQAFFKEARQ